MYDKGPHIEWWHNMLVGPRFELMRKYGVESVTNKLIFKMWKGETNCI